MVCRMINSITVKAEKVGATKWRPLVQELGRQLVRVLPVLGSAFYRSPALRVNTRQVETG